MTRKILITTDVRFWRRQTGAEQRIFALAEFLQAQEFKVGICFTSGLSAISSTEALLIEALGLEVTSLIDDWEPDGLWQKMIWQAKCVANAAFPSSQNSPPPEPGKPFAEFESKEIAQHFHQFLKHAQPDIVLIEYVTLAYLVPPKNMRGDTKFIVDTHDVLSTRNQVFQQNGFPHWVDIAPKEEANALQKFDLILAIQPEEANQLSQLVNESVPVVVAGHSGQVPDDWERDEKTPSHRTVFGMLASANAANIHSVEWFLDQIWKPFDNSDNVEFVLAGTAGEALDQRTLPNNVRVTGRIDKLSEFYSQIDVVINPVQFGTGLKIKSVEAIAFGKPLLTTPHGLTGIECSESTSPFLCADAPSDWTQLLQRFINEPELVHSLAQQATEYARTKLTPNVVYAQFITKLQQF